MRWPGKIIFASAVLVSLAAAGFAATATATASSGAAAPAGFVGYKWQVTAITHGGKPTPIPARDAVYLEFGPGGRFGASDPVNFHSGTYHQVADGFGTGELAVTLVLYVGGNR